MAAYTSSAKSAKKGFGLQVNARFTTLQRAAIARISKASPAKSEIGTVMGTVVEVLVS